MRKFILLCISVLLFTGLYAQKENASKEFKHFLAINGGYALPVGDFSSSALSNENAGLATDGYNININLGYGLSKKWGIMGAFVYTDITVDESVLISEFALGGDFKLENWKYYGILAGPMFILPASPKLKFDANFMIGAVNFISPKLTYSGGYTLLKDESTISMPIQTGVDMQYLFGKKGIIFGGLSYFYAEPKFNVNESSQMGAEDFYQKISVLNLFAGVGFRF